MCFRVIPTVYADDAIYLRCTCFLSTVASLYKGASRKDNPKGRHHGLTQQKRQEIKEAFELFDTDGTRKSSSPIRFSIPMIKSEDILEKDNGGILQEITETERTVSSFRMVVEREEAVAVACEDGGEEAAAVCEDEDETCTGEARRMSELQRVSGE
ncbi:hypothetical protein RHSIM_Rhsim12G0022300 [Rhododendron simsii]|uniref:Uncharacterized protein n=1 Tax=Rhododendron simsii TaxID=118357 RepID=A0A834G613_RHOSS|nr:hypothetical protein RHSIM_Rhsim12G0022300 [Rhododendron simsii]